MDRGRAFARGLSAAFLLAIATVGLAAVERPHFRAERWLRAEARLDALTMRPRECLAPSSEDQAALVAIGRTAFRTSALLGGLAAKAGMSCASCHRDGRGNPAFAFPGVSGDPGTADVTSSLMSSHRGNGIFDPRPIPDLAVPAKVSRDPASPALATFVHGLVTEEFDGVEPGPATRDGLLAYLRALRSCVPDVPEPVTVEAALDDIGAATHAATIAIGQGDAATARLMLAGARSTLGDIDERYAAPGLESVRSELRDADRQLLMLQHAIDARAVSAIPQVARWHLSPRLVGALRAGAPRSYYDRAKLAALLGSD